MRVSSLRVRRLVRLLAARASANIDATNFFFHDFAPYSGY